MDETVLETGWDGELCSDLISLGILKQVQVCDGARRSDTGAVRREQTQREIGEV